MTRLNIILTLLGAAALLAALLLGPIALSPADAIAALFGGGAAGDRIVIWQIRLPRALAAYAVGALLGLSGAALQGLLRNPLADPGVLGVSATASLFAAGTLAFGIASPWALPIAAIVGALLATGGLAIAAARTASVVTLILIGVGLSSFAGALMALMLNLAPNPFTLADLVNWSLGTVANRSLADLALAAPFAAAGAALLLWQARGLSALTLGEEAAAGVGLNLSRTRLLVVLGAGLATGASVSLAGAVGFVGLVAPHLVRPWVGHDPARTLVPAALLAGAMLTLADLVARLTPASQELKLGVVAALIGAPAFVWIAAQRSMRDG